jgi:hypothetical protein
VYVPVPVAAPPAVEYAAADAGYDAALHNLAMPGAPTYTAAPLDGGVLGGAQPLM